MNQIGIVPQTALDNECGKTPDQSKAKCSALRPGYKWENRKFCS